MMDARVLLEALAFAADGHCDQRRRDTQASPYINHPIAVASILWHEGAVRDPIAIVAGILHDTVEYTETTSAELVAKFGAEVAAVVAVTTSPCRRPAARSCRASTPRICRRAPS
jgi:guanosine-3',5'-bis(diphosphate) 3'-pyrophosphohydrolase